MFRPENDPVIELSAVLATSDPGMTAGEHGPGKLIVKLPENVNVVPDAAVC